MIKNDLKDLELDELETLKSKEKAYLNNGDVLLEAMLNVPFKNKGKIESLLKKISVHKSNINIIDQVIYEKVIDARKYENYNIITNITGGNITGSNAIAYTNSYYTNSYALNLKTTSIKYINDTKDIIDINVIDDVYQSVLGNYYLQCSDGNKISLNRVYELDIESSIGKWYDVMNKNFHREVKLKRILKDEK